MAKNITISLSTVFNGSGIKSAIYGMQEMQNVTKNVQQSLEGAKSKWEQMATTLSASIVSIEKLNGIVQSMASAYSNAELNATRLEVIMRQRMKSTDAEISSIKKLTSAQAELGIISAGVQRAGAQQLATFLYQKSSLEVLIPAMNNLVAQQRGFNAEAGDAVNVANLMGKAMMGMTSALRRVGITFTEAQEAAIKNGNEQERAAMLAQIITDNVGEMNAALAKTDAGKQKQLANSMGALKAKIGSLVSSVAPYLNVGASIANMAMGFMNVRNAAVAFVGKLGSVYMAFDRLMLKTMPFTARVKWAGAALRMCGVSALKKTRLCHKPDRRVVYPVSPWDEYGGTGDADGRSALTCYVKGIAVVLMETAEYFGFVPLVGDKCLRRLVVYVARQEDVLRLPLGLVEVCSPALVRQYESRHGRVSAALYCGYTAGYIGDAGVGIVPECLDFGRTSVGEPGGIGDGDIASVFEHWAPIAQPVFKADVVDGTFAPQQVKRRFGVVKCVHRCGCGGDTLVHSGSFGALG